MILRLSVCLVLCAAPFGRASADCMAGLVSVLPQSGATLSRQPMLLLEGFGTAEGELRPLAKRAALVSGKHRVPLRTLEINSGSFSVTQAVLVAKAPLIAGRTYHLRLPFKPKTHMQHYKWTASKRAPQLPRWLAKPAVTGQDYARFGCGPARTVEVRAAIASTPFVRVKLIGRGNKSVTYVVMARKGQVRIGHGMCSGPFMPRKGERYVAELTPIGPNGAGATSRVAFTYSGKTKAIAAP